MSSTSRASPARMSSGSNPATTTGMRCRADERLEDAPARDRGGVPRGEEPLDARIRHLGDDFHHRGDVLVGGKHREVVGEGPADDCRRGHGGRLESGREEDHLFLGLACELDGLGGAVNHPNVGSRRLGVGQGLDRSRYLDHVAIRRDQAALAGQGDSFVDLRHVGDAHRAARPHDHVEILRERGPQTPTGDRLLVASAHVHDRDRRAPDLCGQAGDLAGQSPGQLRVAKLHLASAVDAGEAHRSFSCPAASISPRTSTAIRSSLRASARSVS